VQAAAEGTAPSQPPPWKQSPWTLPAQSQPSQETADAAAAVEADGLVNDRFVNDRFVNDRFVEVGAAAELAATGPKLRKHTSLGEIRSEIAREPMSTTLRTIASESTRRLPRRLPRKPSKKEIVYQLTTCTSLEAYYSLRYLRVLDYSMRWLFPILYLLFVLAQASTIASQPDGTTAELQVMSLDCT